MWNEIHYTELTHGIVEAEKPQDLQGDSASRRPRRANGVVSVQRLADLRPTQSRYFTFGKQEKPTSQFRVCQEGGTWGRVSIFVLLSLSTDWVRPTHIKESNLFYSVQFKY